MSDETLIATVTEFLESCRRGPRGEKYVIIGHTPDALKNQIWPVMAAYAKRHDCPYVDTTRIAIGFSSDTEVRCISGRHLHRLKGLRLREALMIGTSYDPEKVRELLAVALWQPALEQPALRFGL